MTVVQSMSMNFAARSMTGFVRNTAVAVMIGTVVACGGDGVSLRPLSAYTLSPLVSDGAIAAVFTDTQLRNPWGLAALPGGPMWVANNLDHSATQYDGTGNAQPPMGVDAEVTGFGAGDVTGIVASNSETDFMISDGMTSTPARFLFVTESSSLRGWNAASGMRVAASVIGVGNLPRFTGLAIATSEDVGTLYATDFQNGNVVIFDNTFALLDATGKFVDATLPEGYAPWNIKAIQRQGATVLAVAYALRDAVTGEPDFGAGKGAVNIFDTDGVLLSRLIRPGGKLDAPWGLAVAPASFGRLGGALLVASNGDGIIRGFSLVDGTYLGLIADGGENPIQIDGLKGLAFGNGALNQRAGVLYLTAGSNNGTGGLYARIDLGTEPPDLIAPDSVSITAPAAATTVSGTINVTAGASDNVGVVRVVFSALAGGITREIGTVTTEPFGISWNSGTVANGPVSLTARAFDANGNSTVSAAVAVTVDNAPGVASPTVSITSPAAGEVSGLVTVTADASDDVGVASVEFFVGATSLGTDYTAPYSAPWNALTFTGNQDLTAVATDGEGNPTTSAVVSVNVVESTVTLAQLQTSIFTPLCSRCHNGSDDGFQNRLNLANTNASYNSMVGIASETEPGLRVQPFNPASSYLVRKLEGSQSVGEQMPPEGLLDQTTVDQVRTWIQAGALR